MSAVAAGSERPAPAADQRPLSQLAIVALVTAFTVPPLGLVLAVASLLRLRSGGYRGRGLALTAAVAAVVVGAALIAAAVVLQHSGVVFVGGGTRSFGWYGYSPLSAG